ncbi:NAD-binding protein [Haloarchaeobius amylolyticus]|uniref:NAD-binding protein n=1 Tax=Haloarchaeobius amylolyticus TaxID=1198296 RepID=UPI00226D931B|nr:NAD-binding protein [Haloarchaeobius amylolyticus]
MVSTKRLFGARAPVLLTMAVAVLSIVTGLTNIGVDTTPVFLGTFFPEAVQETAGFTGALTGFVMLVSAWGLRRGLRVSWYISLVLFPVTAAQGVIQGSQYSYPLIVLSLLSMPALFLNRRRFDREVELNATQKAAGLALVGVQLYGTIGAFALRDEFPAVAEGSEGLIDAFYFTIVTASTVGYGDVTPGTFRGELFAISVVVLGTASFAVALGALFSPIIEARFARALGRMTETQLELLEDHVIVLGYGDLTEPILEELTASNVPFVVITPDPSRAAELSERDMNVLTADPSDEEPLQRAQLKDATAVVAATNNDAEDALAVLTARQLRPDVRIVAAATDDENAGKLRRAGADTVISPASIGGHLLVESALSGKDTERIADEILETKEKDDVEQESGPGA